MNIILRKILKILIWIVVVFVVLFVGFAGLGFYRMYEKNKTGEAIERINSRKITLGDVMGDNLPPKPDQVLNDSTVAGIDANNNVIRDDVELAIFEKYPDSAKIRAAMLQYAQALQLELTEVFNSETLVKVLQKETLGGLCIGKVGTKENFSLDKDREKIVENLTLNTGLRQEKHNNNLNFLTTYSSLSGEPCDVDLSLL